MAETQENLDTVFKIVDMLVDEQEWSALSVLARAYGGTVSDYIHNHPECPW